MLRGTKPEPQAAPLSLTLMKRLVFVLAVILAVGLAAWLLLWNSGHEETDQVSEGKATSPGPPEFSPPAVQLKEDLSANYLEAYANPNIPPQKDLLLVRDVLDAFLYTVKEPGALPAGSNREVLGALLGDNPYRIRFVDPGFDHLNEHGQIVDRWQSPLFFHFEAATQIGIRSAGPDKVMWSEDDLVLRE